MRRLLALLILVCASGGLARAQTGTIVLSVTSTPTPIVVNQSCNYVVVQENSASPSNSFTITLPGQVTGINYPAGTKFVFTAQQGGYLAGQTIGSISIATSTVQFIGIESVQAPTVPALSKNGGGGGNGTVQSGNQFLLPLYPGAGTNPIVGPSNIFTDSAKNNLTIPGNNVVAGPRPYIDATAPPYNARSGSISGTANVNGTTTVTLGSAYAFVNGDGVTIYGAGPNSGLATPPAPTAALSFEAAGETVPETANAPTPTGSSTYSYRLVTRDRNGGLSAAGPAITTTTGLSSLGPQTFSVSTANLTEPGNVSTLTITTNSASGIQVGALFHFWNSTNAALSGMYNVTSVTNSTTFVADASPGQNALPIGGVISATGGTITYMVGNTVFWIRSAAPWEYIVCAERPGDSSYHIIGLSYPSQNNSANVSGQFSDYGATISAPPQLPSYITDSVCTQGSATPDFLSTTILSGAGTTSIIVANAASQTASGLAIYMDAAVGINAALTAATTNSKTPYVLIPPAGSFFTYSPVIVPSGDSVYQAGVLELTEPVIFNGYNNWTTGPNSSTTDQFSQVSAPPTFGIGAWPVYFISGPAVRIDKVDALANQSGGSQALLFLIDGATAGQVTISHSNCSTGNSADYNGICIAVMQGGNGYQYKFDTINANVGPGNSSGHIDTTWSPAFYLTGGTGDAPVGIWEFDDISANGRGIYATDNGGPLVGTVNGFYMQGGLTPSMATLVTSGAQSVSLSLGNFTQDTSPMAHVANWQANGVQNAAKIDFKDYLNELSVETSGGRPYGITGLQPENYSTVANVGCLSVYMCSNGMNSQAGNFTTLAANNFILGGSTTQIGVQGTDTKLLSAGTVSGATGSTLCTDANNGATTTGCTGGGGGSSIFTSYQFGSATAITGANNYLQLAFPAIFSTTQTGAGTSGSPFVDTLGLNTQNANFVWAGPCTGGAVAPVFRSLCSQDIPNNAANTTGNAATATKWATARNLAGNSADGSANVNFTNKVIEQGTSDAGFPNGQYLGLLGTGIMKNTTTTGVVSLAASSDVFGLWSGTCNSSTFLRGDGACAAPTGSGTVSSGTPDGMGYYSGTTTIASTTPPVVNGQYTCGYFVSASTAVIPTCPQVGMAVRAVTGTTSTDTILYTDNSSDVNYQGSVAVATALPTPTTLTNPLFVTRLINNTSGSATAVTVTATTLTFQSTGSTTLTIPQGQQCLLKVDPSTTVWDDTCSDLPAVAGANVTITRGQYGPTFSAAGTVYPSGSGFAVVSGGTSWGTTLTDPLSIGHGGTNAATAANALINLFPTATRAGDIVYCGTYSSGCTSWTNLAGNNSGTQVLEENSSGVPSWAAVAGFGTVTSVTVAGTANQITATGTCTITTTGTCTLSLPNAVTLGSSGNAGTLSLFPASGNFTTQIGTAATANNIFNLPAAVFTNNHMGYCAVTSTTCTWTDTGYAYNAIPLTAFSNLGTAVTVLHGNASGNPSFAVVTPSDATGNTSGSGNFCLVTSCAMTTPNLGTPSALTLTNATGLPCAAMPALTGHVTTSAGACATTVALTVPMSCEIVWGGTNTGNALQSGDDAIANQSCYNKKGVTETITAVYCRSDAASNTTTVNPTFGTSGTGTTILSGALTCGSSGAYSSTGTVTNASLTDGSNINPAMSGTLTGTSIHLVIEYTIPQS